MREAAQNAPAVGRIILALGVAIGCTVCFGPGLAYAQTGTPEIKSKVVPSGERRQLAFLTSLNPDCSVNGADETDCRHHDHGKGIGPCRVRQSRYENGARNRGAQ